MERANEETSLVPRPQPLPSPPLHPSTASSKVSDTDALVTTSLSNGVSVGNGTVFPHARNGGPKDRPVSGIVPPYWSHHRNASRTSQISLEQPAITLEDHTEDPDSETSRGLWARSVSVDDHVVVQGKSGIGAYVVWSSHQEAKRREEDKDNSQRTPKAEEENQPEKNKHGVLSSSQVLAVHPNHHIVLFLPRLLHRLRVPLARNQPPNELNDDESADTDARWLNKIEKEGNNSVRCGAKHGVEGSARSQIDTAQKAYNHCNTQLCVQWDPESRVDSGPPELINVLTTKMQLLLYLHLGKGEAIISSKSPKHSSSACGVI
ncbi:unnamed protein product [Aspergillus oryzae]|uniref:Unnamed protein product n=2 Tax=Aspergillus oryzae TaxID=5062 RepID=A0AAN5BXX8_ASPOZ|nr:unnamed protein product [Aspergillus oryzae]GMF92790.1 unnamed protein product [Aspergillus oryzae]GMG29610.1 unnamed protein product [Aspergillus oryzae]GMG49543.1 unnamed protein product [Aspergillus oryzae var. brunneus]